MPWPSRAIPSARPWCNGMAASSIPPISAPTRSTHAWRSLPSDGRREEPPMPTLNPATANRWRFPDHAYRRLVELVVATVQVGDFDRGGLFRRQVQSRDTYGHASTPERLTFPITISHHATHGQNDLEN